MARSRIALLGLLMAAACAETLPPEPTSRVVAPLPKEYTCEQKRKLAVEFVALPDGSILQTAVVDYDGERKALRAVHKLPDPVCT